MSIETLSILAAVYTSVGARGTWPTVDEVEEFLCVDIWDQDLADLVNDGLLAPGVHGKERIRLTGHGKAVLLEAAGRSVAA